MNFIGGAHVPAASGAFMENIDPSTGKVFGTLPDSDAADVEAAVTAAERVFPVWRDMGADKRAEALLRLAQLVEDNIGLFVDAECVDNGKPLSLCRHVDIPRSIANLRFFAEAGRQLRGQDYLSDSTRSYTLRHPYGVAAAISPWNLPLLLFTWKCAPALAAGNCVVAKPSEVTPLTAYLLSTYANAAGIPAGVLNVLHGKGAGVGTAITQHPRVPVISFTGGTATGRQLYATAAQGLKRVSLELGGKNATIVFDDADMQKALIGAKMAGFTNQGQICLCGSRLLVQENIYETFRDAFVAQVKDITVGDPLLETTVQGAMVSKQHMEKVLGYIDLAEREGGRILAGGHRKIIEGRCAGGYFIEPTVIEGLSPSCRTMQEEIFGPVVTLTPFKDEDEAVEIANGTPYGLAASLWTQSAERAARVAARIDSGIVWTNCWNLRDLRTPFGGMKQSGIGREGGLHAVEFFTEEKTVTAPLA